MMQLASPGTGPCGVVLLLLALAGCGTSHSPSSDAGSDGGVLTRCEDAFPSGVDGDACDFTGSCTAGAVSGCCVPSASCVAGALRLSQICGTACMPWTSCDAYVGEGGAPGDECDGSTFGTCTADRSGDCPLSVVCDAGLTVEIPACPLPACGGATPPPADATTCRDNAECESAQFCLRPGESVGCGVCMTPFRTCESDADCAAADHCREYVALCSCGGTSTECVPDCASAADCASGESCDAGTCVAISCMDPAYSCPVNTRCGGGVGGDGHGCTRLSCTTDSDCDCGACVGGACYDTVGVCSFLAA
ncbi:MAG: hypothetical protein GW913_03905 [Myxococcales bacterium]|nr:hypothetical protein [Myxococcales bacterium]